VNLNQKSIEKFLALYFGLFGISFLLLELVGLVDWLTFLKDLKQKLNICLKKRKI